MTSNQLKYWENEERKRSNRAQEVENHRSNVAKERETYRSNLAKEKETNRSNLAKEVETNRSNLKDELLTEIKVADEHPVTYALMTGLDSKHNAVLDDVVDNVKATFDTHGLKPKDAMKFINTPGSHKGSDYLYELVHPSLYDTGNLKNFGGLNYGH